MIFFGWKIHEHKLIIKRINFLICVNILRETLESDFESYQEYKGQFISIKTKLNHKIKDLQKGESHVASDLAAALSSMKTNFLSMAEHKTCVNLPKLNIGKNLW